MILLFDIGNTHTHLGLADGKRVVKQTDVPTFAWFAGGAAARVKKFVGKEKISGAALCSVVPRATPFVEKFVQAIWKLETLELNSATVRGIGVDVNQEEFPPELRAIATSLKNESGEEVCRAELAVEILRELDFDYARICGGKFSTVADEWETGCATIGKKVSVQMGTRFVRGQAEALDDDGALLVRTEHGHLERIIGGDVTLEK